jgi:hypothetical protein
VRDALGWSNRHVAQEVGATSAIVDRWAMNDTAPREIMIWMEGLLDFHQLFQAPKDWKRRPGK